MRQFELRKWCVMQLIAALCGCLFSGAAFMPPALARSAQCNVGDLSNLKIQDVTIASANEIAATKDVPEHCDVVAALVTREEGAEPGLAHFQIHLPAAWNHRFLFLGCGGECGSIASISAEAADVAESLPQGYAVVNTDTGHTDPTDAWTLLEKGRPNIPALTDFYYRAVHQSTVAAKALVKAYYSGAIDYAYFDGCSTGGRQGLMEADRYPEDFDGIIAGDAVMAFPETLLGHLNNLKIFAPASAYLPAAKLQAIDSAVRASCDIADGVADGLSQNPAACAFDPETLVPDTLTRAQAAALKAYMSPIKDPHGNLVFPGYSASDLATVGFLGTWTEENCVANPGSGINPWSGETTPGCSPSGPNGLGYSQPLIASMTKLDPDYNVWDDFPLKDGVVSDSGLKSLHDTMGAASSDQPDRARKFLERGGKLIMYHGFSDPSVSPYQSIRFYNGLAKLYGGIAHVQDRARLFMVPGMGHCSGGPGPNTFDTLGALHLWVSRGVPPKKVVATNAITDRSMPLCPYPAEATYIGGNIKSAQSWVCKSTDRRMSKIGHDGRLAHVSVTP